MKMLGGAVGVPPTSAEGRRDGGKGAFGAHHHRAPSPPQPSAIDLETWRDTFLQANRERTVRGSIEFHET